MAVIILEGENKTGKTTIANILVKQGFKSIKCSQPKGEPFIEYKAIIDKIKEEKGNFVIDRFHWGEEVYGPIYRGKSGLTKIQFKLLEKELKKLDTKVIYCYDIVSNIRQRFIEEKEEYASIKKIRRTLMLYSKVRNKSILPITCHRMKTKRDMTTNGLLDYEISKINTKQNGK